MCAFAIAGGDNGASFVNAPAESMVPRYWFPKRYAGLVQRLRVTCGFLLLVVFAWLSQPSPISLMFGLPVSVIGVLLRGWAAGHLAKDRDLATSGPYAYMRNPLYMGTLITTAGIVIASRQISLALFFGIVFLLVYLPAIELEEQHLRTLFPEYANYAARVNRFLPSARLTANTGRFSWRLYWCNQEYKALIGFLVAVAWLVWRCRLEFALS